MEPSPGTGAVWIDPFDATLAEFSTRELPLEHVVDLLAISHAPERVAAYRDAMRRGARFPPVSVLPVAGYLVVADGHKRLSAYRALGYPHIVVEVWPWRRFVRDQIRQARDHVGKTRIFVRCLFTDRPAAWRLLCSTLAHWRRVARSLAALGGRATS